ncbi:3257_t:CDS:1, partial [Dentiscutata heterogama]
ARISIDKYSYKGIIFTGFSGIFESMDVSRHLSKADVVLGHVVVTMFVI